MPRPRISPMLSFRQERILRLAVDGMRNAPHAFGQGSAFAPIHRQRDDADQLVSRHCLFHHPARAVAAAVVDEDELVAITAGPQVSLDLFDGARQPQLLVVARDHHAQSWALVDHGATSYRRDLTAS